jgi:DNA repair protein RecN (Recombination protein N)
MLTELVVEDLGVIERVELTFERGSSALTGETGAGKTLVVAALGLLLGGRADRSLVRSGASEARVEARFSLSPDHPVLRALEDIADPASGDGEIELILSRTVSVDGRGRVRVNGRLAPAATLAEIGPFLVEIAGQNEHLRIASSAEQRGLLDLYAGDEARALAAEVTEQVKAAARAEAELERISADESARAEEIASLQAEIAEIEGSELSPGESDHLKDEASRLEHAEAISASATRAEVLLRGDGGIEELLGQAAAVLEEVRAFDPALADLARRLDAARYEIADVAAEALGRMPEVDPDVLEQVRARLGLLRRLQRRYGEDESTILSYAEEARGRLAALGAGEETKERWRRLQEEHAGAAFGAAKRLSAIRAEATADLHRAMGKAMRELALSEATFEVRLEPRALYEGGLETVEFAIAANPGEEPKALSKIASGGELSRIALAVHLVTTGAGAETLVFDEVDAGVGGEAAQAIGRCLAELARGTGAQVLVVTHLPQVAAFADTHYRVTKDRVGPRRATRVAKVDGEERLTELSRMLAGLPESDRARSHARELLDLAISR